MFASNQSAKDMNVSVVITNYNGEDLLEKNLSSVVGAFSNKKNNIVEVLVADDASTDASKIVSNKFGVKFVSGPKRGGYSVNVNRAVKNTKGELVCIINNDVTPSVDFLEDIDKYFKDEDVFAITLHEKGRGWASGKFENGFITHSEGGRGDKEHISFWASGGSGVFRKKYWDKLGGFDEVLMPPFYWEDLDISYRAWKRGWKVIWAPGALVVHNHESTMKKLDQKYLRRIQERNQLLFVWKNLTSSMLFRRHISGLLTRLIKSPGYLRIILMALKKLPFAISLRKIEKRQSKVSDESILALFSH